MASVQLPDVPAAACETPGAASGLTREAGQHLARMEGRYRGFSYFQKYPVDALKLDRSFVGQLTDAGPEAAIAAAGAVLASRPYAPGATAAKNQPCSPQET